MNKLQIIDWILILILITTVIYARYGTDIYKEKIDHCSGQPYTTIIEPNGTICYKVCPPEYLKPQKEEWTNVLNYTQTNRAIPN